MYIPQQEMILSNGGIVILMITALIRSKPQQYKVMGASGLVSEFAVSYIRFRVTGSYTVLVNMTYY